MYKRKHKEIGVFAYWRLVIALVSIATVSSVSYGQSGAITLASIRGLSIASIYHEKCTGKPPLPDQAYRQFDSISKLGVFPDAAILQALTEGAAFAEGRYPGKSKPTKADCQWAIPIYQAYARKAY